MTSPPTAAPLPAHWADLLARIDEQLRAQAAHPARSVVLLPDARLCAWAAQLWASLRPQGFAPRFETTRTWAARVGVFEPGPHDFSFQHGRDWLTAASLLEGAGFGDERDRLAGLLLELTQPLALAAASQPPALRPTLAERARQVLPPGGDGLLRYEAALMQLAVVWSTTSDYATDVLFSKRVSEPLDALIVVPGLQPDLLAETLVEHCFEQSSVLALPGNPPLGQVRLHACADGGEEAERAVACVLAHVQAGRTPVALVAGDRVLTRRISALLEASGVRAGHALRDETGWRLSTTHAAAALVAALQACRPWANGDEVLAWLKLAPAFDGVDLVPLEKRMRRLGVRRWAEAVAFLQERQPGLVQRIERLRQPMAEGRAVVQWLLALRELLQACGLWRSLQADVAGSAVLEALGLDALGPDDAAWGDWPHAQMHMGLAEFAHWVRETLEAASYRPPHPAQAQVVVLPLAQVFGRWFAAAVLPGADAGRLPAVPEPAGGWSEAQRAHLHLPTRESLRAAQQAAWEQLLAIEHVEVLWRESEDSGEPLQLSPLVQAWALTQPGHSVPRTADWRTLRQVAVQPSVPPRADGSSLPLQPVSASAYERLRDCPYRFFALRQLGLGADEELDQDLSRRDWGSWLHAVLGHFHEALAAQPQAERLALIEQAATRATQEQGLAADAGGFLPFAADWPRLRDAYLVWLSAHEAQGACFDVAELDLAQNLKGVHLKGRIDRRDRLPGGQALLIDYKTERPENSKERVKPDSEDIQLAFYALLGGPEVTRAAYLNLGERAAPSLFELPDLPERAARLRQGLLNDVARIEAGAPLLALGEGRVCDWCEARGLCRKDFWS